jgi:hypothetical protein
MKLGIIGLPRTGKKTIFQLLTGSPPPVDPARAVAGVADIRDDRFESLVKMYEPRKRVPARINLELLPDLDLGAIKDQSIFRDIADTDAICHVARGFTAGSVYHVSGSVNAERDVESVNDELILHDLIFIEKRMERIEKAPNKKNENPEAEIALLKKFSAVLEDGLPLRTLTLDKEEQKIIASYPFITLKSMLVVLNIDDSGLASDDDIKKLTEKYSRQKLDIMKVSAAIESEIALLDTESERAEFMKESNITEPALNILSRLAMKSLGLISFFTVGKDEVRQWQIKAGSSAPEAAGAIHSDIQRGFIRAEVFKYADLSELGTEDAVKKAGRFHTMGKDYIVEDGDIINFRFNV